MYPSLPITGVIAPTSATLVPLDIAVFSLVVLGGLFVRTLLLRRADGRR